MAMITLRDERDEHADAIERVLDATFGAARHLKTCQRLRDGQTPIRDLSLIAMGAGKLVGTVRLWPMLAGRKRTLLLGPLAVDPDWQDQGVGAALINEALRRAKGLGEKSVILVGDADYYGKFGFAAEPTAKLALPGPVERARFLANEMAPHALEGAEGLVRPLAA